MPTATPQMAETPRRDARRPVIYAQLVAGFIYLLGGGDLLVRGGVALARRLRVAPVVVALTVVALGTSLPELMVSIRATISGYPNLILGNVVGSNIANVLLVGGAAVAVYPLRMRRHDVRAPGLAMLAASLLFAGLCLSGDVSRFEGGVLLAGLLAVFGFTTIETVRSHKQAETTPLEWVLGVPSKIPTIVLFVVIGAVTLPLGADLLVDSAVQLADRFGVSETVIGLSIVAIGTSLPEVATTVLAAMRGRSGMALGTILGSNTFNLLAIMGIAAGMSAEPIPVSSRLLTFDLPVMIVAAVAMVTAGWFGRAVGRRTGVLLLAAYLLYLGALYLSL